jgi:hypothetical protein
MAKSTRLTRAAAKIGATAGRISGRASKARKAGGVAAKELQRLRKNAGKEAAKEIRQLTKLLNRMKRDLDKASKRVARSLR